MIRIYPFILSKILLPLADMVIGTSYSKYIRFFRKTSGMTGEEIVSWQNGKIRELAHHIYKNVPFYTEFMNKNGIRPEDIKCSDDLRKFPVINKQLIKDHFEKFVPGNLSGMKYFLTGTGGSTGIPMKCNISYETQSAMWSKRVAVLEKYDFRLGEHYLALGSSSIIPTQVKKNKSYYFHKMIRMHPLNAANMDDNTCIKAVSMIRKFRIRMIYGYASSIFLLAKYVLREKLELPVDVCITTSEKLTTHYDETIRKAFKCAVIDEYGAREGGVYSYKCEKSRFHMIESCVFRIEDDKERGNIIATNLINDAMPLINYDVEDVITSEKNQCSCGDKTSSFSDLIGRKSDIIELDNGHSITGPAFTILFSKLPVKYYQICKVDGSTLEVRIEKGADYTEKTEDTIRSSFNKYAGSDCNLMFNYNHKFELLKSGKRNYFVN